MTYNPKKHIDATSAAQYGRIGIGLTVNTATLDDCALAISYLTEGYAKLLMQGDKATFFGDNPSAEMLDTYFQRHYRDATLKSLTPEAQVATIINRLASRMDANIPIKRFGISSRMEGLWFIQHQPERSV